MHRGGKNAGTLVCKNMILGANIDFRLSIFFLVSGITGSTRRILTLRPLWEFSLLKNLLRYGNQVFFFINRSKTYCSIKFKFKYFED